MNGIRPTGRALLGALVSGALATGAIGGAAPANADCFSIFGLGNGNGCTSSQTTYAIGIGSGAQASATGLFGGALAIGTNAQATMSPFGLSAFNFATAIGNDAIAQGYTTLFGIALQMGPGTAATLGFGNIAVGIGEGTGQSAAVSGLGGIALQLGPGSASNIGAFSVAMGVSPGSTGQPLTSTGGFGGLALNLFGDASTTASTSVTSTGFLSAAVNVLGRDNVVAVKSDVGQNTLLNLAFGAFGSNNTVNAGPGTLAIAGSIFQRGATVAQQGPGFNINGFAVGREASAARGVRPVARTVAPAPAATARRAAAEAAHSPAATGAGVGRGGARDGSRELGSRESWATPWRAATAARPDRKTPVGLLES
jgi:hypothetical protein